MRKLYEIFKLLWIQKRIVAAATIWGNTVSTFLNLPFASLVDELTSSSRGSATQTDAKMASDTPEKMRIDYRHIHHMSTPNPEFWINNFLKAARTEPPKFCWSSNISLINYQLSVFLSLLFAEKINSLLVNQQKNSQLKLVLRSWKKSKQNLVKKIFGDHQISIA